MFLNKIIVIKLFRENCFRFVKNQRYSLLYLKNVPKQKHCYQAVQKKRLSFVKNKNNVLVLLRVKPKVFPSLL
jgi:hypothetical protein